MNPRWNRVPRLAIARLLFPILTAWYGLAEASNRIGSLMPPKDTLRIFFTFDARGRLPILDGSAADIEAQSADLGRWAHLSALSSDPNTLLLDCGETFFPGALSRFSYGNAMNEILTQAHTVAKRVSSRDFLLGHEVLEDLQRKSPAVFLATNLEADSGKFPFRKSHEINAPSRNIVIYSLLDPEAEKPTTGFPVDYSIGDPELALRERIASEPVNPFRFRICLADEGILARHPGLLKISGIDLFAAGAAPGSQVVLEALQSGGRVIHVPPLAKGIGSLTLQDGGSPTYVIDTSRAGPGDSLELRRMTRLVEKWSSLYMKQNAGSIRTLNRPLEEGQAGTVASLIRERLRTEAACIERSLIQDIPLPAHVRVRDLDRLLLSSPDLYVLRIQGSDLRSFGSRGDLACAGIESGRVDGRPIDGDEIYTVGLTETEVAASFPEALSPDAEFHPVLWSEPLFEAIREDLVTRREEDWSFSSLSSRWRLAGQISIDASRRDIHVWNGDSVNSVPGSVQPLSTWDLDFRAPLRFYNALQSFDFSPEIGYSKANEEVGNNLLSFRLDYSYGPRPAIRPYGSGTFETYLIGGGEEWPVRIRGSLGLQSALGTWTLKIGAASEKTITASEPNPFAPFAEVFASDTASWDQGVEFVIQGTQDLGKQLHRKWPKTLPGADLSAELVWNNFIGISDGGGRMESRFRLDLAAGIFSGLDVKLGLHSIGAYLFGDNGALFSVEPSLALSTSYRFKALP
jgi:hypothetical protein